MRQRKRYGVKDTCSKCGKPKEMSRGRQRYCKSCHAEYMRRTRPKHKDLPELARKKQVAGRILKFI